MLDLNLLLENQESTVVARYERDKNQETNYQTEDALESSFIKQLQNQEYQYLKIKNEDELVLNLRLQLERLNDFKFSDGEWKSFFEKEIANQKNGIKEKTRIIQENHILLLKRDDGSSKNIYLIDKKNIHDNSLQVVNQYENNSGNYNNRYDVTVLINGLPLVHVELKKRGVDIREAFNQIKRYNNDSFWAGCGLFEYVQIFVISNGTYTKYYSNTTRDLSSRENQVSKNVRKTSNSFEFTSWWADAENKPITDLIDFAKTFFSKHTILNILTKYCVFTVDEILLVMRPYQIVATERILSKINVAYNYKKYGSVGAGGYVWHTTGSGKTLTSFKTSQLATRLPFLEKVLFVVDRKDLDYQTMKEYNKFEKGSVNGNKDVATLKKQLEDSNVKIIVTTIQKLNVFIKKYAKHEIYDKQIVIIFDECHRSQFGDMHKSITKNFKKYYMFGFTGTPIFTKNCNSGSQCILKTTEEAFGEKLHTYTIVDAINDKNVLPFRVDYVSTMRKEENIQDLKVWDINRERALMAPERIANITKYILEHFDQKTMRNIHYTLQDRRLGGFNSIFATSSIEFAKLYYNEFQKQMALLPSDKKLKIATIFSFSPNEDCEKIDGILEEENLENTNDLDASSRDFLEKAISDYNKIFKSTFSTDSDGFQNYYKDVSERMKKRELDLLIVVNMFLTGFDATTLNTLWVDKNLRSHGLLQAYSRTNRILNSIKTFGNIVCFRNLEEATNVSIALFGNKESGGIVLLKTFADYYNGYQNGDKYVEGYVKLILRLKDDFTIGEQIQGEQNQKNFIKLFGCILKLKNLLSTFDEFVGKEILTEREMQDYQSIYLDLYANMAKTNNSEKENINEDVVFEIELIKQIDINIDYILILIEKYFKSNKEDKSIIISIKKSIDASIGLRNKKDLIENFIDSMTPNKNVNREWNNFINEKRTEELNKIIENEKLNEEEVYSFVKDAFKSGYMSDSGMSIAKMLPKNLSLFSKDNERGKKRKTVFEKLFAFFNRFKDISDKDLKI